MGFDDAVENRTFGEIAIGESASAVHSLTLRDMEMLAAVSGDVDLAGRDVASGTWAALLTGAVLRTVLPGLGTVLTAQEMTYAAPVRLGGEITITVTARAKDAASHTVTFDCDCTAADGTLLAQGTARVLAPLEKLRRARADLPDIVVGERGAKFRALIGKAEAFDPIVTAIVHPVEANAIAGAVDAAKAGLIVPHFIGPQAKIEAAAAEAGLDLSPYDLSSTEHSHAAAELAARLAHEGKVHALLKGSLHSDEFLHPILAAENALRTEHRLSHVFLMDVPSYDRLLFITDGAINIAPDLAAKVDIVQNAIGMAHALGVETPRVALLSAVETVNPSISSTLDAAALSKMAERGQITGGIVDGPLAFDNAVSPAAARIKHIRSPVAGQADILVAPDLDAGNMIAKQLEYLAASEAAGVVLGARVPVILTSRADTAQSRLVSCAVAVLLHAARAGARA
ncbi:bifunctional enoyl-CoA hydratase/phosphate acetyltransferase [Novosphingobium beihaiensis]|uniref:Bifunctional enoyl-CoA hydratase/phosphate acetyltransferase n=1 Tax=Novosphingobium beihaiensis TaxID=2930389 RepID=A0ABT0BL92_9SPHN|nr:bifunctional enoyl-CoA hydratase/phosphate acetyltransferase [Novosphingobium beihaiensis]MCJ2185723.1 bifunctional enoyl-CoA hydratase/phosphate acetyltransferase [Novosphingobium beihaiensis]